MAKAPAALTSPKIKKLAAKAAKSPSMLTTVETRELGAAVLAHVSPSKDVAAVTPTKPVVKKTSVKLPSAKKASAKLT